MVYENIGLRVKIIIGGIFGIIFLVPLVNSQSFGAASAILALFPLIAIGILAAAMIGYE